jgi:hypothetical protein
MIWAIVLLGITGVAAVALGLVLVARSFRDAPRAWRILVAMLVLILAAALSIALGGERIGFAFFALGLILGGTGVLLDIRGWSRFYSDTFGPILPMYKDERFARVVATLVGVAWITVGAALQRYTPSGPGDPPRSPQSNVDCAWLSPS